MKQAVRDWLLAGVAFLMTVAAVMTGTLWAISTWLPALEVVPDTTRIVPFVASPGESVWLCQQLHFSYASTIDLTRVISVDAGDGAMREVHFGRETRYRQAGDVNKCGPIRLPTDLPSGRATLRTIYTAEPAWPMWKQRGELMHGRLEIVSERHDVDLRQP